MGIVWRRQDKPLAFNVRRSARATISLASLKTTNPMKLLTALASVNGEQ
jgi:hypothetical protein